jgi:soluble lytic murein transglycosylase-like protein
MGLLAGNSNFADFNKIPLPNLNGNKMKRICSIILSWMMAALAVTPLAAQTIPSGRETVVVHADLQTGKLIRAVVVVPREVAARIHEPLSEPVTDVAVAISSNILEMIDQIATAYGVEGPLVHSVIRAESNYNVQAVSNKGALGLMQLIPSTARRFGVRNPFDPKQNVEGGVRYLRFLLDYYKNDYKKAIAAYNAGEGAVDRYQGVPPYVETRNYVSQVAMNLRAARQAQGARSKAAETKATAAAGEVTGDQVALEKNEASKQEVYNPIHASVAEDGRVYYRTQ